ncbi:MAG: glycoside hydrolase family 2 protein [Actinomycetota bacterium]
MNQAERTVGPVRRVDLDKDWRLDLVGDAERDLVDLEAPVPGSAHTALLAQGLIPDPFLDRNELDVQWVGESDWRYRTTITLDEADLSVDGIDLVFDGLDTLAVVELNGSVIASTENMHRRYRFDVASLLRAGDNELTLTFRSAAVEAERRRTEWGSLPTASFNQPFNYIRKMACSWGWDWGPTLNTCGIWRPAALELWTGGRLASVRPTVLVDDDDCGTVELEVDLDDRASAVGRRVVARLSDPGGAFVADVDAQVADGDAAASLALAAGPVRRWWPHTLGDQPLYHLDVQLLDDDGAVLDGWHRRVGFRTIELDTAPDADGSPFTIVVNGRPLFAKGLNWIPDDPLVTRITADRYHQRLNDFRQLGADLIRVWGGGIYESDDFYQRCDEEGILVWQDFLFVCAAYDEERLGAEVELEAADNVERLMSHPSLALWNGNNENFMGWFEWGWPEQLAGRSWGEGFYLDRLPDVVAAVDRARPYWPGSPWSGSMELSTTADEHGVRHVWDVWNQLDYRRYRDHVPRFVAEFGWQAPPTAPTLRRSVSDQPLTPRSPGVLHHQKALDGNDKLSRGLAPFFDEPEGIDDWLWATQLNQARAIRVGIEHFRSFSGRCMGTVWWQFNDCWPVTSWAVLDGDGRRKPAWFAIRQAYRPRLLTIQPRGGALVVAAVNDGLDRWRGPLRVTRRSFDGEVLAATVHDVDQPPGPGAALVAIDPAVAQPSDRAGEVLVAELGDERTFWFYDTDRRIRLPEPRATIEVAPTEDALSVTVRSETLLHDVALFPAHLWPEASVDEQLTTLLPGEAATFHVVDVPDGAVDGAVDGAAPDLSGPTVFRTANHLVRAGLAIDD